MGWSAALRSTSRRSNLGGDIQRRIINMKVRTIGIDLGKAVFHVVGLEPARKCGAQETTLTEPVTPSTCQHARLSHWHGRQDLDAVHKLLGRPGLSTDHFVL